MKALERDPEARFQTAGELERALVQCVLNHAQSPDDTDVATFVRRVYIGMLPSAQALPAVPERTQQLQGAQLDAGDEPVPPGSTSVLPGPRARSRATGQAGEGSAPEPSPDEDVHASTHMLPAREGSQAGKSKLSRVTTPGRPIPAVSGPQAEAVSSPAEAASEPPRYEPTVSLPSQSVSAPPPSQPAASSSARRVGTWVGIGVVGLLAAVGADSLLRSRPQEQPPTVSTAQSAPQGTPAAPPSQPERQDPAPGMVAAPPSGPSTPPAESSPPVESPAVKPAAVKGSLIVRATPYATVLVNGRSYGDVQGQKTIKLDPGSYQLVFQHPKGSKTERFTLEPNGTVKLEFRASR
jgi:serine/threonine-protein kinase